MKFYNSSEVAKILGVAKATVTGLCHDGILQAVNIARRDSKRCSWRISEDALKQFQEDRSNSRNKTEPQRQPGKMIKRPTKDYFAK